MVPDDFDWMYYVASYKDLIQAGISTEQESKNHWIQAGSAEGRSYKKSYDDALFPLDYEYYTAKYPELKLPDYFRALCHYQQYGKYEGKLPCQKAEEFKELNHHRSLPIIPIIGRKVYAIITYLGYPFGGGEAYLHQTMTWMSDLGYQSIWFSFSNAFRDHEETKIRIEGPNILYDIRGKLEDYVNPILDKINPQIVHTQGRHADQVAKAAQRRNIRTIVGYHFWGGLVKLDPSTLNIDIIGNIKGHQLDPTCQELGKSGAIQYVASDFMAEVLEKLGYAIDNIIYPVSDPIVMTYNPDATYVLALDVSELKGGRLVLRMMQETLLPFIVITVAPLPSDLNQEFERAITLNPRSKFLNYQQNIKAIYAMARVVLITTLVDETFCRVAYEAASCGIPILTTGNGFIRTMIGSTPCVVSDDRWSERLIELYNDQDLRLKISSQLKDAVAHINPGEEKKKFTRLATVNHVMILVPWCDTGLGIQGKLYSRLLRDRGHKTYIFSFNPYIGKATDLQSCPDEWDEYDGIYYSPNEREQITDDELMSFVDRFTIDSCLIPETCFYRIFEVSKLLRAANVATYAIPNIETIRKSEIDEHRSFTKILAPVRCCQEVLALYGLSVRYIGHGVVDNTRDKRVRKVLKFLHVAGTNAVTRKNTIQVVQAFKQCQNPNITLTVTIEKNIPDGIEEMCQDPRITLVLEHLDHSDIIRLYQESHVSIQVSSHEGIGLGFYESISCSTPVISLDTPPHNEVVIEGKTGWLISCYPIILTDNPQAIIMGSSFNVRDLSDKIDYLSHNLSLVNQVITRTTQTYREKFSEKILANRLINELF